MRTFETDLGSLGVIATMTRAGRNMLDAYLRDCDRYSWSTGKEIRQWHGIHFTRNDVLLMKMEHETGPKSTKIVTTIDFANGARWRRGSLRMTGIELPDTMMNSIKGHLIEELVANAPVVGFRITHAVHDRSAKGVTLRVRCDGEKLGPIPYDPPAPHRHLGHGDGRSR